MVSPDEANNCVDPRWHSVFAHILVPVDFTSKNQAAVKTALRLAETEDTQVTLLHVIEEVEYAELDEIDDFYDQLKAEEELGFLLEKRSDSPAAPRMLEAAA